MVCQLEFFNSEMSDKQVLEEGLNSVRESTEKVRKSLFAKHGDLARKYAELSERLQILERNICSGAIANPPQAERLTM